MVRLIPTDRAFFNLLNELATRVRSAAALLTDLLEHPDQHELLVRLVREDEHAADDLTQQIVLRLGTSFVPPLDATEIYDLAKALDATIDLIEDAAVRVRIFELWSLDVPTRQLGELVLRAAGVVEQAVAKLADANTLLRGVEEAWRLEEEGDAIYGQAMSDLFASGLPVLEVLKRKEMYDILETAIDRSRDVAEVLTSIAVKRT